MYKLFPLAVVFLSASLWAAEPAGNRRPQSDEQLRFWLEVTTAHRFSQAETAAALELSEAEVAAAQKQLNPDAGSLLRRTADEDLLVLPYPGGRHPRIGFLDGAVNPQRETKVSVFAPWADGGYAVADVPEAIWHEAPTGRKLLYLAHTHVPTIWDEQKLSLEPLEWKKIDRGGKSAWQSERTLPNQVSFGTVVVPERDHVHMQMWLANGTGQTLRGLVVQNCVLLKGLAGFEQQTNDNKLLRKPYVACHNADKTRWIITAWEPCHRPWANPPCPCLHSDPRFPDCDPAKTVRLTGWLSFFEGKDIDAELARIESLDWRKR